MDNEAAPPVTQQLKSHGPETLGHETNLARAPMWVARASDKPVQLALLSGPLVMHATDFRQVEGAQLTVADQRLVAELTTRFLNDSCPESRIVNLTLSEAAEALGYEPDSNGDQGGKGLRAAKASLARIRSVTFSSALSGDDRFPTIWGLIDNTDPISPRGGRPRNARDAGYVTLNKKLAQLLRGGHVTFLHYPTWDAIARADAIAGRLWCYLEAERITTGWNYNLFAAPPDGVTEERYMPAIADMLLLDWPHRKQVAWRVRRACAVICELDTRYQLEVLKSRAAGMWYLRAHRSGKKVLRGTGPIAPAIRRGWRRAYGPRNPSAKQAAVLDELALRRGATWVGEQLAAGASEGDPFRSTLRQDRDASTQAIREAGIRERAWEEQKAREAAEAPQTLAAIMEGLLKTRTSSDQTSPLETRTFSDRADQESRTSGDQNPDFQ